MRKWLALALMVLMALSACAWADEAPSATGTVTEVEKYGHARLDITIEDFEAAGFTLGDIVTVTAGTYMGDMPYLNGYYVDAGEYMVRAYPGHETIAICINYGRFADVAGIDAGDPVTLKLKEKAGALTLQEINNLVYTTDRADYTSDEVFANFRQVTVGEIGVGKFFRSASPVDNQYGRAAYAGPLVEAAGVRCVMNLANTPEWLEELFADESFNNAYYQGLYDNGLVIALGMSVNYASDEFAEGIVTGLTFLAQHDGPYLVHCTEGKDRAGFTCILLEALMGASEDEIIADYMLSYRNYYGIVPGTDQYELIAEREARAMLRTIASQEKGASLEGVDLQAAAVAYLTTHGMVWEDIEALQSNLR